MEDRTVAAVARRLGRTNAQVLIRWSLQQGFICLPKSSKPGAPEGQPGRLQLRAEPGGHECEHAILAFCNSMDIWGGLFKMASTSGED